MIMRGIGYAMLAIAAAMSLTGCQKANKTDLAVKIWPGEKVFKETCASCHEGGSPKAPPPYMLQSMSPATVLKIIDQGVMKEMAAGLSPLQRRQVVEYLTKTDLANYQPPPPVVMCDTAHRQFAMTQPPPAVGWGYDNRRFVPAAVGGLRAEDLPRLRLKWAFAFPDASQVRSQPVVAMGAVFTGSHNGDVFALDLATGCVRWVTAAAAEVRTAVVVEGWPEGTTPKRSPRAFFGDVLGNVYGVDAVTGKELWRMHPDQHHSATITGSPTLAGDTLYVPVSSLETGSAENADYACCTFRGSVVALDVATGRKKWQAYTVQSQAKVVGKTSKGVDIFAPSGAPVWASPTVDRKRGLLYFGSGENYTSPADGNSDAIIAVDLKTGERRWTTQLTKRDAWNNSCMYTDHPNCPSERGLDQDLASSIMIVTLPDGRDILLGGDKSGKLVAVDPDRKGALLWSVKVGRGSLMGGIHFGMSSEGTRIYVPIYDSKTTPQAGTYPDPGFPGMHMVDAATGKIVWRAAFINNCGDRVGCEPGISAATTAIPGAVLAGHVDGWMRAYDSQTGKVIWQLDTTQPFTARNGAKAKGGSMSGPGPAVYGGNLIIPSGYGFAFKMPGNALLVFALDGK